MDRVVKLDVEERKIGDYIDGWTVVDVEPSPHPLFKCKATFRRYEPEQPEELAELATWFDQAPSAFERVLDELRRLHDRKGADYDHRGQYSNVRGSEDFGVQPWIGAMIRANEKMKRIQKFAQTESLVNESVEDSLMDLAVYAVIGLLLFREGQAD